MHIVLLKLCFLIRIFAETFKLALSNGKDMIESLALCQSEVAERETLRIYTKLAEGRYNLRGVSFTCTFLPGQTLLATSAIAVFTCATVARCCH